MSVYIHTLNGKPAVFDGEQLCYVNKSGGPLDRLLRPSLETIRDEQRASTAYRERHGWPHAGKHDYIRLSVGAR